MPAQPLPAAGPNRLPDYVVGYRGEGVHPLLSVSDLTSALKRIASLP